MEKKANRTCGVIWSKEMNDTVLTFTLQPGDPIDDFWKWCVPMEELGEHYCGKPAPHENPYYLQEMGTYNYARWLCDEHWEEVALELDYERTGS